MQMPKSYKIYERDCQFSQLQYEINFLHLVQLTLHTMHEEEGSPIAGKPIIFKAHTDLAQFIKITHWKNHHLKHLIKKKEYSLYIRH